MITRSRRSVKGADHATVTVETPDRDRDYQAKYLIGCDGASSVVRKLMGLEFEGFTWPERFVATNVHFDVNARGWQNVHMICSGAEWGLVAKINNEKGGLWRVTFPEDPDRSHAEIEARIHNHHYKRILPDDGAYELQSWAPYRVHERTAPTYNVGRIVLAGDRPHLQPLRRARSDRRDHGCGPPVDRVRGCADPGRCPHRT